MNTRSHFFLFILFLLFSCERYEDFSPYETFVIKSGRHGSGLNASQLHNEWLVYDVIFDESSIYTTQNPSNQSDVNKIFGFSDCNSNHLENSARFGWRWFQDELQVLAFVHFEGEIKILELGTVELNKSYRYELFLGEKKYFFRIKGVTDDSFENGIASMDRSSSLCKAGYFYKLWPYFGGDEFAPHDISIYMRRVYGPPE